MFKLAFRNIFRHKVRTALTAAAIIFGVAGLILSGGFVHDVFIQLGEATIHSQLGHIQIYKAGYYERGARNPSQYMIEDPARVIDIVGKLSNVDAAMSRLNFSGLLNNGKADLPIIGEGGEPDKEAKLGSFITIIAGRQLTDKDAYGILIGEAVAHSLKIRPGDRVTLLLNTAEGSLNSLEFEVVGIFRSFSKDYDARGVRIPLPAAQELLGARTVNAVVLSLKETGMTDAINAQLKERLPSGVYETKKWNELADFYEKTIALYDRQFGILRLIIFMMVLLSVANSVNMSLFERTGEFGTLMALGNRRKLVFQLVLTENLLLGFLASGAGVVIGISLALGISAIGISMPPPPNANSGYIALIRVVPSVVATAFFVGLFATLIASLLPTYRVTRMPVVEALRQN